MKSFILKNFECFKNKFVMSLFDEKKMEMAKNENLVLKNGNPWRTFSSLYFIMQYQSTFILALWDVQRHSITIFSPLVLNLMTINRLWQYLIFPSHYKHFVILPLFPSARFNLFKKLENFATHEVITITIMIAKLS